MKTLLMAVLAFAALEGVAYACSCIVPPDDPARLREMAALHAPDAIAVVEIEALNSYTHGGAETVRVVSVHGGKAPAQFVIQRGPHASSASCDIIYEKGQRDMVILYPGAATGTFRTSGLCTQGLLGKAAFHDALVAAIARRTITGERG